MAGADVESVYNRPPIGKRANRESRATHAEPDVAGMAGKPAEGRFSRRLENLRYDHFDLPGVEAGIDLRRGR